MGNATLLSRAETLHSSLDTWIPPQGVSLYEIAGWGEDTLAAVEYYEGKKTVCGGSSPSSSTCSSFVTVPTVLYNPKEVIEGDGTVLVPSALWTAASTGVSKYWVDLNNYNNKLPQSLSHIDREHADILEIPELRALLKNILTNTTLTTPLNFISTSTPLADSAKRLRFLLHSPLNLSATDNLGNTVNSSTSTIPGSRWKRYGEVQVLTVPKNTPLTLNLEGYAAGSFTLNMEEIDGSNAVTASSTFSAVPSTASTKAEIAFPDGTLQNAEPLLLDYDGNGTTDFSLESEIGKEVVFDITPPEATLSFDPVSQKIQVTGTDNLSATTVLTTATSSLISDQAGNTLQIIFKKNKQTGKELKVEVQGLYYNGISAEEIPKTVLRYEWSTDKTGKLKELEEKATVGTLKIEGHYSAKKNVTSIDEKVMSGGDEGERDGKKILPGLALVSLITNEGKIYINF